MNTNSSNPSGRRKWLWPVIVAVVLLVWTVYCEANWYYYAPHLRAVPAFFLGALLLLILNFVVRLCSGAWRNGWRWLVSRDVWRMCAWTIAFAVSVVALFYAVELWRGKQAWASVVREAKARGESLDYESSFPPQPPDDQNFAKAPLFAPFFKPRDPASEGKPTRIPDLEIFYWRTKAPPFAPWLEAQKSDLRQLLNYHFKTNLPVNIPTSASIGELRSDEQIARALLVALEKYRPMLDEVRRFSDRPKCWFPQGQWLYEMMYSPSSDAMRALLRLVRLRASAELAVKRPEAAFEDIKFGLRVAEYGRQCSQPDSTAYVLHHEYVMDALQPVWEGLAEHCWSAGQVAEIQTQLEKLDLLGDYPNAVRADALTMATMAERLIPTTSSRLPKGKELFAREEQQRILDFVRLIYPRGWSLQDQAAIHRFHLEFTGGYLDLPARRIAEKRFGNLSSAGLFASSDTCFYIFLVPKVKEYFSVACEGFPFAQTAVDLATLACALERHRLANGDFPGTPDVLVPKFIAKLPYDVITGEPLKYRRTDGGGFMLYSVGLNKVDDGGKLHVRQINWEGNPQAGFNPSQNDWVWTCPAPSSGTKP